MALPDPEPGLVIRYDCLWEDESAAGRDFGKDRPACLVASIDDPTAAKSVVILPITHTRPEGETIGVEIPSKVRAALGLDDEPCWVIVTDFNVDDWPNAGLAPIPGQPGVFGYGFIPPGLFRRVKDEFGKRWRSGRARGVRR